MCGDLLKEYNLKMKAKKNLLADLKNNPASQSILLTPKLSPLALLVLLASAAMADNGSIPSSAEPSGPKSPRALKGSDILLELLLGVFFEDKPFLSTFLTSDTLVKEGKNKILKFTTI